MQPFMILLSAWLLTANADQGPAEAEGPAPSLTQITNAEAKPKVEAEAEGAAPSVMLVANAKTKPKAAAEPEAVSAAERIARLQRGIEANNAQVTRLQAERDDPESEYARAKAAFDMIDQELETKKKARKELLDAKQADQAATLTAEIDGSEKSRALAKDRFDLAIEERKTFAEQIANLKQTIQRDTEVLAKLDGNAEPEPAPAAEPAPTPVPAPAVEPAATSPVEPDSAAVNAAILATTGAPMAPASPTPATTPTPESQPNPEPVKPDKPASKEMIEAREDAQTKSESSKKAEDDAQSVNEQLKALDKDILLEKKLLETARKQHDNATKTRRELDEAVRVGAVNGAAREELTDLSLRIQETNRRLLHANEEVRERVNRLEDLQTRRSELQGEQIEAMKVAARAEVQVKLAETQIKRLENPFSPRNVLGWLIDHGPKMLGILLAMVFCHWIAKLISRRIVRLMATSGARGSRTEREDRARTLVGVFQNASTVAISIGSVLMLLQEIGVPIAPLLGGAAVFGLAIAFGAQNLIRDYFYGFVILLENQYKINDVVQIGETSGQVERITLRMTVLRDLSGCVHFLPNGQINSVTNMTHVWSRAVFDIGVGYKEDVDRVIAVIQDLGKEMRADPTFGPLMLEDLSMLGVESLGEWSVVIKFFIKTRTLQQWLVKREMLRRIKNRFDELNIEIPFPCRTVYHRYDDGVAAVENLEAHTRPISGLRRPSA